MAKVVLVWNEHPTEVVAGFHARKVAKILKEKYGHEVIVEKVPFAQTNLGVARKAVITEQDIEIGTSRPSIRIAQDVARTHGAHTFNFHCSPARAMSGAETKEPGEFKLREYTDPRPQYEVGFGEPAEITIHNEGRNEKGFVVEMPAVYKPLKEQLKRKEQAKRASKKRQLRDSLTPEEELAEYMHNPFLGKHYYTTLAPIGHPAQQKYLHPAISEKIAAAIHERISRKA